MTNKQKFNKLCNIRTDLTDDSSSVTTINSRLQSVADDFADMVSFSGCGVKGKIEGMKEPSQWSDTLIQNARSYCQYEINKVDKELKSAAE